MKTNWRKNAAIFLGAQALSLFGSSLVQYAVVWHITLSTQSGIYTMIAIFCGFLPTFFLSPFGGVWADKYNRKLLIILSDGFIAITTLVVALLVLAGYTAFWMLFTAMALRAIGTAVQTPSINAMLPDIVPEEKLTRVNGINQSLQSVITLLSPLASVALISLVEMGMIFFIDVITAVAAILVMVAFLHVEKDTEAKARAKKGDYLLRLKEGIRYIGSQRYLRHFFLFCAAFYILASPVAFLTPLQVTRNYVTDPVGDMWRLSAVQVVFSVGMMLGGTSMAIWGGKINNRVRTMAAGCLGAGVFTFALGLSAMPFWGYCILVAAAGLCMPIFNTQSTVLLQERVEPNMLGRVFGVMSMLSSALMPMGMIAFGPLSDIVPIEWLLLGTAIIIMAASIAMSRDKVLVEAGKVRLKNGEN